MHFHNKIENNPVADLTIFLFVAISLLLSFSPAFAVEGNVVPGSIKGVVVERATRSPIASANVIIVGRQRGAASDLSGKFSIEKLEPGLYHVRATALGYEPATISEIHVMPDRTTSIEFLLIPTLLETEEVVYRKKVYFQDVPELPTSSRSLRYEEVRRAPGGVEDVQRMIQAFPGVAGENDQNNEIVVRGGSPFENLTVIDGIEVDNINHYGYEGGTGGPISALDPDFLQEVTFASGGFSARYGDRLSSVLAMDLREGDREAYHGEVGMGMAGAGANLEGPLPGGNGSILASWRKSYLDLIKDNVGLTAVPNFWDTQTRIVRDISPKHSLSFFGLYGNDVIKIEDDEESGYSRGAESVDYHGSRIIAGAKLRSLWGWGFSDLVVGRSFADYNIDVQQVDSIAGGAAIKEDVYWERNEEVHDQAHLHITGKGFGRDEWSSGVSLKPIKFTHNWWLDEQETIYEDGYLTGGVLMDGFPDTLAVFERRIHETTTTYKYASYLQYTWRPLETVSIVSGLRYDGFDYSDKHYVGPRVSATWDFLPRWTLSTAYGVYYQSHPMLFYTDDPANKDLPHSHADQYVAGISYIPRESSKLSVEVYYKDYDNLLVSEERQERDSGNETFRSDRMLSVGTKEVYGFELFAHQKLDRNWYGILSYSWGEADFTDPVHGTYRADYDFQQISSVTLGYKTSMTDWRITQQHKPWWWWTYVLPVSGDELMVSSRLRYISGRPYDERIWYGEGNPNSPLPIYEGHWDRSPEINGVRYPAYSRWDVRIDSKYFFGGNSIIVYVEAENVLDRGNIAQYIYADNGERDTVYQFRLFIVGGVKFEF
ncbi:MAG: TonB-dependent receptor [Candidatus Electryonea clarkiae]|nr:TonB-dependent receptor [Candidatus Electryonea clarkiae]